MAVLSGLRTQLEKVDQQILELLEQRVMLFGEALEEGGVEADDDVVEAWVEAGMERGLDEAAVERVCRAVLTLSRKGAE